MTRYVALILPLSALVFIGTRVCTGVRVQQQDPVYALSALQTGVSERPVTWVGRTLRVQAIATTGYCFRPVSIQSPACDTWRPALSDPIASVAPLPLAWSDASLLLVFLRRLPLLGPALPPSPAVHWGSVATYRVRLAPAPATACASPPCYQALLLDAATDAPGEGGVAPL
jgi:hypothetical protein